MKSTGGAYKPCNSCLNKVFQCVLQGTSLSNSTFTWTRVQHSRCVHCAWSIIATLWETAQLRFVQVCVGHMMPHHNKRCVTLTNLPLFRPLDPHATLATMSRRCIRRAARRNKRATYSLKQVNPRENFNEIAQGSQQQNPFQTHVGIQSNLVCIHSESKHFTGTPQETTLVHVKRRLRALKYQVPLNKAVPPCARREIILIFAAFRAVFPFGQSCWRESKNTALM